jgi:hypothetical protein
MKAWGNAPFALRTRGRQGRKVGRLRPLVSGDFIAAGLTNPPGKFEEAESNEATSYLPESAKTLAATEELQDG